MGNSFDYIARFETLSMHDVDKVGGKNSSLGEMIHNLTDKGVRVPGGFATTADAFREYLSHNGLADRIAAKHVRPSRVVPIPVWSRRDEIYPLPRAGHPLRDQARTRLR